MWLNKFKVALVQKDAQKIDELITDMPQFATLDEMKEAAYLLCEAQEIILSLQADTKNSLLQIEKNIKFLKSTQADSPSRLDLTM